MYRGLGDEVKAAEARVALGVLLVEAAEGAEAEAVLLAARAALERAGAWPALVHCERMLCYLYRTAGEVASARLAAKHGQAAPRRARRLGGPQLIVNALYEAACGEALAGSPSHALALAEEGLRLAEGLRQRPTRRLLPLRPGRRLRGARRPRRSARRIPPRVARRAGAGPDDGRAQLRARDRPVDREPGRRGRAPVLVRGARAARSAALARRIVAAPAPAPRAAAVARRPAPGPRHATRHRGRRRRSRSWREAPAAAGRAARGAPGRRGRRIAPCAARRAVRGPAGSLRLDEPEAAQSSSCAGCSGRGRSSARRAATRSGRSTRTPRPSSSRATRRCGAGRTARTRARATRRSPGRSTAPCGRAPPRSRRRTPVRRPGSPASCCSPTATTRTTCACCCARWARAPHPPP